MSATGLVHPGSGRAVTDYAVVRHFVMVRDQATCQECGRTADQVDHIWPRKHGGEDHVENLRAICGECNRRKGDRVGLRTAPTERLADAIDAACARAEAALGEADRFAEELHRRHAPTLNAVAVAALLSVASAAHVRAEALQSRRNA